MISILNTYQITQSMRLIVKYAHLLKALIEEYEYGSEICRYRRKWNELSML